MKDNIPPDHHRANFSNSNLLFFDVQHDLQDELNFQGLNHEFQSWDFSNQASCELAAGATHFGFVRTGQLHLAIGGQEYPLKSGMYFSVPGEASLRGTGEGIVVSQLGFRGLFSVGGPIEKEGRLRYIDGCSDTLLLSPVVKGDPCLNFLRLPPFTNQTSHVHPSFRFGIIVDGNGFCDSPAGTEELWPGKIFFIGPDGLHRFRTESDPLSAIAFHPDSDFGPEDDNHPMVNKTIVNGISAAKLSHSDRRIKEANNES